MADPSDLLVDRTLLLLRHAKSVQHESPDHERPLADRGRRDAAAAGEWIAGQGIKLDLVLCSSSVRTRQTWKYTGLEAGDVWYDRRIYEADPETLLEVIHEVPEQLSTVMLIGHAPSVPWLATELVVSGGDDLPDKYATTGLAVLTHTRHWSALGANDATLAEFVTPRG
jgi:phosphohistidine phosphatase